MKYVQLYDVVATDIRRRTKRVIAEGKTKADAEAIVKLAVMRRGVDEEFFTVEPWPGHILTTAEPETPHDRHTQDTR